MRSSTQAAPPTFARGRRTAAGHDPMYHRVHAAPPSSQRRLTVHPVDFARQMRWLKQHGYRTITQRELYDALFLGKRLGRSRS